VEEANGGDKMKFKTIPAEIEAIQFDGTSNSVFEMCDRWKKFGFVNVQRFDGTTLEIETLEGTHRASKGDWIVKGLLDEFYPCKPKAFEGKYEPV
jgi:hypothetical protein